jgi:hypothetical protein
LYDNPVIVKAAKDSQVLATITLPYTDPREGRFASILTDPPGRPTDFPALVFHPYGKGKVLYSSGGIETWEYDTQTRIIAKLLQILATRPWYYETDAPKAVEITLFEQPERKRYVLNLQNYQRELPNIPVYDINLKVWLEGKIPQRVVILPEGKSLEFTMQDGSVEFIAPRLDSFLMFAIEYQAMLNPEEN